MKVNSKRVKSNKNYKKTVANLSSTGNVISSHNYNLPNDIGWKRLKINLKILLRNMQRGFHCENVRVAEVK